jgi:CARDB
MKKSTIATIIIVIILLLLGGLYWLGYLRFENYVPSFTTNPGESSSETTPKAQGSPKLTIDSIRGRLNKISVSIKNIGDADAKSVNWTVLVTGGILKRIDSRSTGTINTLTKDSATTVISDRIPLGIGRLQISVTVDYPDGEPVTQTARGFKLFFFVVGVRI